MRLSEGCGLTVVRGAVFLSVLLLTSCNNGNAPHANSAAPTSAQAVEPVARTEPAFVNEDRPLKLTPRQVLLANGKTFALNIPEEFDIKVAAEGLKRVRFMAESPDHRIFVTDMLNLSDNNKGSVYILGELDRQTGTFGAPALYLSDLRNPNSIAFHTDPAGVQWLYLALTDRLVRYPYKDGDKSPSGSPQTLAVYPDSGLSYKYGGWHLTRTVAIGANHKVYVSVGSSCNVCEEKEEIRATVSEMDLDGSNSKIVARGLRNAVGMKIAGGRLFVTNMGADHLGDDRPEETMHEIRAGADYGWPYCYEFQGKIYDDDKLPSNNIECSKTPLAFATFAAHSSPLGLEYFDSAASPEFRDSFLVSLHGSSKRSLRHGYRIARIRQGRPPEDFIVGFQQDDAIHGRPADIMKVGADAFLFTDDLAGVVYFVYRKVTPAAAAIGF